MDELNLTSTNFTNMSTSAHPDPSFSWGLKELVPAVLLSLCFLVGVPGNVAVIILKPNWQNLSKQTQYLMMNLALSDLLCLITLPLWIYTMLFSWTLGTVTCKIVGYFVYCSLYNSLLTVTALSFQRHMQVVHQQRRRQFKKRLLVLMWLTSMLLSIPDFVFRQVKHPNCRPIYASSGQQVAVLLAESFVGFSSFTVIVCSYISLNRKLNQSVFFNNVSTSRLVTSIIVTFSFLWMPYCIFNIVTVAGILEGNLNIVHFYDFGFYLFGSTTFINSCTNPLLYAFALKLCHENTNPNRSDIEMT